MNKIILILSILIITIFSSNVKSQEGWIQQNSGINTTLIDIYFINPDTGWVVGNSGRILKTEDGGENWNFQVSNTSENLNRVFFIDENKGWIVGLNGKVLYTTNSGITWNTKPLTVSNHLWDIYFLNDSLGWICGHFVPGDTPSVYKTTDGGYTWFTPNMEIRGLYENIYFANQDTGWVIGYGVEKTTDGGNTWIHQSDISNIHSAFFLNENIIYGAGGGTGAYKTINGGEKWEKLDTPQTEGFTGVSFADENTGWLSGSDMILKTTDGGESWLTIHSETNVHYLDLFFINANIGWVIDYNGKIFKTTTGGTTNIQENIEKNISIDFHLNQNYPNPFNPTTTIKYNLNKSSNVILKIYNLSGQELGTLVNRFQAAGEHEIDWQPEGLSSGIYFYKLQAGEYSETKKLILQK